ncbi:MAG: zinc ribbon domain-containing protein [Actinobacteria bacterium]|nr:zinc ribbon domain-containing protein [Actinomycetota bacterium]OPZ79004.1 MAG: Zinc ribbon domain protein [Actinobacteria bacterium ADurb.Bin444]
MASYDLHCRACGRDFDIFVQGFIKDHHKVCPDCSSRDVEQRFTGGFVVKGSGGDVGRLGSGGSHSCATSSFG